MENTIIHNRFKANLTLYLNIIIFKTINEKNYFLQATLGASAFLGLSLAACNDKNNIQELIDNTSKNVNGSMFGFSDKKIDKVKIGIIGLGNRGNVLLQMFQYLVKKIIMLK